MALAIALTLAACGGSRDTRRAPLAAGRQQLEPGRNLLDLTALDKRGGNAPDLPMIEITLPAGWSNYGGWALGKGKPPFRVAVGFWDVVAVYPTPCRWAGKPMVDPGREVDGLASALANQPLRGGTAPTPVELAGFRGKYLELSVPRGIDFAACDEGAFESWTAQGWAGDRYQQAPGQVDRLWILDVNGQRLVVDATYLGKATDREREALERVVRSIRFVD